VDAGFHGRAFVRGGWAKGEWASTLAATRAASEPWPEGR
jgi:hypothetical protein